MNESQLESEILDYLAANPAARDTARGIMEWWLLKQHIARTVAEVDSALAELVAVGKLQATNSADGRTFYSLPQQQTGGAM